tara:strand:- start:1671 stop:2507 length:837 start_codon:yes stop_codon:yes gene_type:complete
MSLIEELDGYRSKTIPTRKTEKFLGLVTTFIISDINSSSSTAGMRKVVKSIKDTKSLMDPFIMPATTPETLEEDLKLFGMSKSDWTYPLAGESRIDIKSGLHLTGYNAKNIDKVMSCLVSHMRCWLVATAGRMPIIVLEHDALIKRTFNPYGTPVRDSKELLKYGIIGLNSPKGATRNWSTYMQGVLDQSKAVKNTFGEYQVVDAPWVDSNEYVPQGLAGNSAYLITPNVARNLLGLVEKYGLWPNDALMCKQLLSYQLKQIYPFVSELQGISSTTQG